MKTGTSPDIMLQKVVDYDAIVASGKIPTFLIRVTVQVIFFRTSERTLQHKEEKHVISSVDLVMISLL